MRQLTPMQHTLSAVFIAAVLCFAPWGYGGSRKQQKALTSFVAPVAVRQSLGQAVINEQAELAILDKSARSPWTGDVRQKVQALFARLKQRRIAIQPSFYQLLGKAAPAQRDQLVSHCQLFFDNVDTQEIVNTLCLSSMIKCKKHMCSFLLRSDDAVRRVAKTPALRSLTSLFHYRGFPQAEEDTQAFMEWDTWWPGDDQRCTLDRALLRTFSSMFSGKGLPDKKAVDDYLTWEIWWQGEGDTRTLDRELLRIFSAMFNGKGLPNKQAVEDYLNRDVWWQGDGQARTLDRGLLRVFSSMLHGKGLPSKKAVDDYLNRDVWWQGDGPACTLDRQLLSLFSAMFNGKGLPDKQAVDDYLNRDVWWQGDGQARRLDRGLLQVFSSMLHGKGLPSKKAVDDYLNRDVWWQGDGQAWTLDRELLRAFSSIFHGKGLPDKKAVENYLQLDIWWQEKGQVCTLDRELLRAFSSMFHGRGLPDRKVVENYLQLDIWWQGQGQARTLDRELLRIFSSMFNGRGLPNKKAIDDYLQRDVWWQGDGKGRTLDRELLRTFSSMFCGRGLPDKKAVEDYLQRDIWWQGNDKGRTLDRELLRTFSSMFSGRGLPDKKAVEDYLQRDIWWQGDGKGRTLDRELLRTFSSMFSGRGLPDKKAVEDYLQRDIWWQGDGKERTLDRELLRIFSSMFSGRGLPDKKAVEDYLQLDVWWQGEGQECRLDRGLLRAFSSMFHGKGLPETFRIDELLQWLTCDQQWDRQAIKIMVNLYSGAYTGPKSFGLPDLNKLREAEQKLIALILPEQREQEEDEQIFPLIKMVALYLANHGGMRQLSWNDCEAWLREHPRPVSKIALLRQLLRTLHYHGGRGIKEAVALIFGKPVAIKWFVLDAMGRGRALASVQYALGAIEPGERRDYLFFTRELQPEPSVQEWQTIKGYLETLAPVQRNQEYQRRFLTLIWPLSASDRERFVQPEAMASLTTLLPNIQVMRKLSKSLSTVELKKLFDTCLTYRAGRPDKQGLPILFKALLLAQLPPFERVPIIPGVLAQTDDQPEGVVIKVNPALGVKDSVMLFVQVMAALLEALWDGEYAVNGPRLTLWPHGSTVPITLSTPYLAWHPNGVQIRHWTLADLHQFYRATGCWQGVHRHPLDPSDAVPDTAASQTAHRNGNRTAGVEQPTKASAAYLSVAMLMGMLKNQIPMNAVAWASVDYHKDKLPLSLQVLLQERADADNNGLVPESLKTFLFERGQPFQIAAPRTHPASPHSVAIWLENVLRQSVLSEADIGQLYIFRDQLTGDQVVDILFRMEQNVSQETVQRWQSLLGEKHQQNLKTNPPWLDDSDEAMEAVRDIEDILKDLFPEALL